MLSSRKRAKCFDTFVESTDTLLRHPDVVRLLGTFAGNLLDVNNNAFLPNIRLGQMSVPRRYQENGSAVAVVPVFAHETAHVPLLIEPLLQDTPNVQKFEHEIALPTSGFALPVPNVMAHYMRQQASAEAESSGLQPPMHRDTVATTRVKARSTFASGSGCRITSFVSRPVEIVRISELTHNHVEQAAVMAHEHAHALDALGSCALQGLPIGRAASELVGYHVTDSIFAAQDPSVVSGIRQTARYVETLRITHADPTEPFTPTPDMVVAMHREGFIH